PLPLISTLFPYTTLFRSPIMLTSPMYVVEGLLRLDGSRSGPSTKWLKSATATYVSKRLEIVSLTPRYWRSAPARAIQIPPIAMRSEEHTSELQSRFDLVC